MIGSRSWMFLLELTCCKVLLNIFKKCKTNFQFLFFCRADSCFNTHHSIYSEPIGKITYHTSDLIIGLNTYINFFWHLLEHSIIIRNVHVDYERIKKVGHVFVETYTLKNIPLITTNSFLKFNYMTKKRILKWI